MSIDSRNKRASALACGLLFLVAPPAPDGSLADLPDRRHVAGLYSELAAAPEQVLLGARAHEVYRVRARELYVLRAVELYRVQRMEVRS